MKILQETTIWESKVPNHIYYVNDAKDMLLAMIKSSNNEPVVFKQPIKFSTRYRTFKEIKVK